MTKNMGEFAECFIVGSATSIAFIVDGETCQTVDAPVYDELQKKLSASLALNEFPVETPNGALRFRLMPIEEVRDARIPLITQDGVTYERRYKIGSIEKNDAGERMVTILDTDTEEVAGIQPWASFAEQVKAGNCRSGSAYADMLGKFSSMTYKEVMGHLYMPRRAPRVLQLKKAPPAKKTPEAPQTPAPQETTAPKDEVPEDRPSPLSANWVDFTGNKKVIAIVCIAVILLIVIVRGTKWAFHTVGKKPPEYYMTQENHRRMVEALEEYTASIRVALKLGKMSEAREDFEKLQHEYDRCLSEHPAFVASGLYENDPDLRRRMLQINKELAQFTNQLEKTP